MREYGKVYTTFWTRPPTAGLSDAGKLLALYCLTGPHSNGVGCYRLPLAYLAEDLNWEPQKVLDTLKELEAHKFLAYCDKTLWVFLTRYLLENPPENPNVAKSFRPYAEAVPQDATFYADFVHASKVITNRLPEWSLNGLPNGSANREPEPEPDPKPQPKTDGKRAKVDAPSATTGDVPMADLDLIWVGDEDQLEQQLKWLRQILDSEIAKKDRNAILGMNAQVDRGKMLSKGQQDWARDLYAKHKELIVAESKRRVELRFPGISSAMHDPTNGKAICAAIAKRDDQELCRLLVRHARP